MEEYLCVIRQDESVDWYLLCVKSTMYCIASGSRDSIIQSIRNIKNRYKSTYGLQEALSNMSEPARPNEYTYSAHQSLYKSQKGKYDFLLRDTLEEEYEKIREKRKPKRPVLHKKTTQVKEPVKKVTLPSIKKKPTTTKKVMKPIKAKGR